MLNKTLFLEIDKPNYVPLYTVQYDYNSRFYEITILNNSQPLDLTGIRVIVAGKKPDGKEVLNSCEVLDAKKGLIQLELTEQMNAVNGASEYALELFSADGMLSSQPFKLIVTRSTISKSVESSKELGALKDALNEVQNIDQRFAETNAQLSTRATKIEVEIERKRIDAFTALPSGSTTGDAELIDARVGADGVTYSNLGDAIRTQTGFLNDLLFEKSVNLFDKNIADRGYYQGSADQPIELRPNDGYFGVLMPCKPLTTYTISESNYYVYTVNENKVRVGGIQGSTTLGQVTVTTPANTAYLVFSGVYANINEVMVVEGDGSSLPSTYQPYGIERKFAPSSITDKVEDVYYVGESYENKQLTPLLKSLQDNTKKKVIYIQQGVYDIFQEIGGKTFLDTITSSTDWKEVSVFVPDNTRIVGIGNVVLNYLPSSSEANVASAGKMSVLNVRGAVEIENITINCQNCRYGIHDETSNNSAYENKIHKYKNVRINFLDGGVVGSPSGICFGCGFGNGCSFEFDSCKFEVKRPSGGALYMHDWKGSATISIKNSMMKNLNNTNASALQFGNTHSQSNDGGEVVVDVENCYLFGTVNVINGVGISNLRNSFNLSLIKCNDVKTEVQSTLANPYEIKVYK